MGGPGGLWAVAVGSARVVGGRGIGGWLTGAGLADARCAKISEWYAAVERGNVASLQLLQRSGFARVTDEGPDGCSYFARGRVGWPGRPVRQ